MQLIVNELPNSDFKKICDELGLQQISMIQSPQAGQPEVSAEEMIEHLKGADSV